MDWSFFDKIYCLNLRNRTDRYKHANRIFDEYNMHVTFMKNEPSPNGGIQGCFESHIKAIRDAYSHNYNNVMILEDDIYPVDITQSRIDDVSDFLKTHDYDIFYLGAYADLTKDGTTIIDKAKKIYSLRSLRGLAYVLSRSAMSRLKNLKFEGTPIDVYYRDNLKKAYAIYPSLFDHSGHLPSSIIKGFDIHEKAPALSRAYTSAKETYAYYIGWSVKDMLMVVCILILIKIIFNINTVSIIITFFILIFMEVFFRQIV